MTGFSFCRLDKTRAASILPELFRILHGNMTRLAPTGVTYREDEAMWLSYMKPRMEQSYPEFVLLYHGDTLAGYFQYSMDQETLVAEEIQIAPEYQRTMLFYRLCQYLCEIIPKSIRFLEAYVNKQNANSLRISQKLGLAAIGESGSGKSWHLRGEAETFRKYFLK